MGVHVEQVLAIQGPGALPDAAHPLQPLQLLVGAPVRLQGRRSASLSGCMHMWWCLCDQCSPATLMWPVHWRQWTLRASRDA